MEKKFLAFIDESGGHGFDFASSGTSTHFVATAILINQERLSVVEDQFSTVKNKYFPLSEIKSSKIGSKDHIRQRLLEELRNVDFNFFSIVVDKRKIHTNTGLRYKESFYKFLYGLLYNNIYRTFKNIEIVADQLISDDFVSSFEKYIKENHQFDLFHQNKISFQNSKHTTLLQLSDLIGGSLNRNVSKKSDLNVLDVLADKCTAIVYWPENYNSFTVDENEIDEFQEIISELAVLRIDSYVSKNIETRDNIVKLRVMFLSYLKSIFLYNSKTRSIYTTEVIQHLKNNVPEEDIDEQFIRRQIVGPLRSEGVLIVSNPNGYKIPSSKKDVITFFNLFSRTISPMIGRLKKTHEALYQGTNGRINMLEYPEFEYLKKLFTS